MALGSSSRFWDFDPPLAIFATFASNCPLSSSHLSRRAKVRRTCQSAGRARSLHYPFDVDLPACHDSATRSKGLMLMGRIVGGNSIAAEIQGRTRLHGGRILATSAGAHSGAKNSSINSRW
jgi:hypothetical protein